MPELYDLITRHFVGRRQETQLILAALLSGRHVILEGPPGTSKSTVLQSIVKEMRVPFIQVTGNQDLTAAKLIGHFDLAQAPAKRYKPEHFQYGPLTWAMREGAILYVEEFNRLPGDTASVFVPATAEHALAVPRLGGVVAKPEFRVVAAMNPLDDTGTVRVSRTLRDRFCSIYLDYQSRDEEIEIVKRHSGGLPFGLVQTAVELTRRTRAHQDVRQGASVRGAIDLVMIARQLLDTPPSGSEDERAALVFSAALMALRGKLWLAETASRTPEGVIGEIWQALAAEWQNNLGL
jgi:MoxR-like ATPase